MKTNIARILVTFFSLLVPLQLAAIDVHASTAPAEFTIPDTTMTIKGFASPNAFVQIFDGDALIGTVVADGNGVFEKTFSAMSNGLHNIKLQYQDNNGLTSDVVSQTINIRQRSDTASEFYLPPTLSVSPRVSVEGDLVTFSGSTIPNATVEIILDGGNLILRPESDANGDYSISTDTTGFYFGIHTLRATSSQGGLKSFPTQSLDFTVNPAGQDSPSPSDAGESLAPPVITSGGIVATDQADNLIRGTAPPNSQIIIFLDGEPIGSTFANEDGAWFFNISISGVDSHIRAIACVDNACSDYSNLLTLEFEGELDDCASFRFWMDEYRVWGLEQSDGVDLKITGISGTAPYEVLIDWGDTTTNRFSRDAGQSFNLHHVYHGYGHFNGSITMLDDTDCQYTRYFSVNVDQESFDIRTLLIPTTILPLAWLIHHRLHLNRIRRRLAR